MDFYLFLLIFSDFYGFRTDFGQMVGILDGFLKDFWIETRNPATPQPHKPTNPQT